MTDGWTYQKTLNEYVEFPDCRSRCGICGRCIDTELKYWINDMLVCEECYIKAINQGPEE